MIQFQNAREVYHIVVILRCTPRCYNDDKYNLYEIKINSLHGFGRHATMTTNDGKILGREKPISKYPYKDKMAEGRLSEQKVPFQDTKIPNLVTTEQSVIKTRT